VFDDPSILKPSGIFGMLVEPFDVVKTTVATKANEAAIDTSLWNIGGPRPEAQHTHEILQHFFH
jgi:hypothetical protein